MAKRKSTNPLNFFFCLLLLSSSALAQVFSEVPRVGKLSPRIAGMGGAFTAVADDEMALFYNPAGLQNLKRVHWALLNPTVELGSGFSALFDLVDQLNAASTNQAKAQVIQKFIPTNVLAGASAMPFLVAPHFGIGLVAQGDTRLEVLNPVTPRIEISGFLDAALVAAYATKVRPDLSVGITGKWVHRSLVLPVASKSSPNCSNPITTTDPLDPTRQVVVIEESDLFNCSAIKVGDFSTTKSLSGFGIDLGALFQVNSRLAVGATWHDLGNTTLSGDGARNSIPQSFSLGIAYRFPSLWLLSSPRLTFDIDRLGDPDVSTARRLHFGAEATLFRKFALRAGINQGYPTAGIGFRLGILDLEYAFFQREAGKVAGEKRDTSQVVTLGFQF